MPLTAEEFRKRVEALERIEFAEGTPDPDRTIPAAWIATLFPEPGRIATHPIRLKRAIIDGDLTLRYSTAPFEILITYSEFKGQVDFFGATFGRILSLTHSQFRKNVILGGVSANNVRLRGCVFDGEFDFIDATVKQVFNASGARFRQTATLERAKMNTVLLRPIRVGEAVEPTRFDGTARFHDLSAYMFDASGVQFAADALFPRMTVEGVTFFRLATTDDDLAPVKEPVVPHFDGAVDFRHARFGSELTFAGARFAANVTFQATHVKGRMIVEASISDPGKYPTRFAARATFSNMDVGENLDVGGCEFGGECWMDRMNVHGAASFSFVHDGKRVSASFEGPFSFSGTVVGGYTRFDAVTFRSTTSFFDTHIRNTISFIETYPPDVQPTVFEKRATFYRMRVDGDFWCEGAEFHDEVNLWYLRANGVVGLVDQHNDQIVRAKLMGPARFDSVHARELLCAGMTFPATSSFRSINVASLADFEGARFDGDADFRGAKVGRKLSLESARIGVDLVLRDADVLTFTAPDLEDGSHGAVDARGLTFQRIDGNIRELLRRQTPYDLEIYEKVERALRTSGKEDVAGAMYVDRRRRETRAHWGQVVAPHTSLTRRLMELLLALYGNAQDLLFRYGVRPLRLAVLSVLALGFGTWVFSHASAVRLKENPAAVRDLSAIEALGYSARVFMPVGDLPSGSGLVPTEQTLPRLTLTYEAWATIERLLGLLLVPLGIASVTGVLVRKR